MKHILTVIVTLLVLSTSIESQAATTRRNKSIKKTAAQSKTMKHAKKKPAISKKASAKPQTKKKVEVSDDDLDD